MKKKVINNKAEIIFRKETRPCNLNYSLIIEKFIRLDDIGDSCAVKLITFAINILEKLQDDNFFDYLMDISQCHV